ncbi:AAA family ATPase [Ensifer sp. ENS04]|uniref:AAA family ATPase n=1 Tax=Ensifer sp. ENS04 TaxID=2769281 RepID=UPI00177DAA34|nr:AAA family ATPase [Ensifer sp. ENS04]MBD9538934.1 AAA family ATPase [Ensifer sp. ENS04]
MLKHEGHSDELRKYARRRRSSRQSKLSESTANLPVLVAGCAIQEIVSRLERGPTEPCVIIAIAPSYDTTMIYEEAASALLTCAGLLEPAGRFGVGVLPDSDRGFGQMVSDVANSHSMFFIASRESDVTADIQLMADDIEVVRAPIASDYLHAARALGVRDMTASDAAFLATQDLKDVRLASRSGRPLQRVLESLKDAALKGSTSSKQPFAETRRLADVSGYGEAKAWGLQLAKDLAKWKTGELSWNDVDRGVLLEGPPGCGKSSFAHVLANTCGVEVICTSFAQWQACGHLGDFLKAMHKSFDLAKKKKPCILFLDEFDSFNARRKSASTDNAEYQRQAVNGLLERLDPPGGREGVVVVAATNDASSIDAALLRPGRLEKVIEIGAPDAESRIAILRSYVASSCDLGTLDGFAAYTVGWTGAQIEKLARDARRIAREEGRTVNEADLYQALPPRMMLPRAKLHRLAVHEGGHAIVGVALGKTLDHVYIKDHVFEGHNGPIGEAVFKHATCFMERAEDYSRSICLMLGGIAAEWLIFGDHASGAGGRPDSDLVKATDIATVMERYYAYGNWLSCDLGSGDRPLEWLRLSDPELRARVEHRLRGEMERAKSILTERRASLDALVSKLEWSYIASGAEVDTIMKSAGKVGFRERTRPLRDGLKPKRGSRNQLDIRSKRSDGSQAR